MILRETAEALIRCYGDLTAEIEAYAANLDTPTPTDTGFFSGRYGELFLQATAAFTAFNGVLANVDADQMADSDKKRLEGCRVAVGEAIAANGRLLEKLKKMTYEINEKIGTISVNKKAVAGYVGSFQKNTVSTNTRA